MEIRQLRCVEAVARHRHFTRAAEELHVAQSALSHQVQRLEAELGVSLFERTSRRVTPTEAGFAVAARARRVLAELDETRQEVEQLRGVLKGRVSIGPLLRAGELDVPGLLARFSQRHPGIEIGLREGLADEMFQMLAADDLDVAFCLLTHDLDEAYEALPLGEEEIVAVFPTEHAPARTTVTPDELRAHGFVGPRRASAVRRVIDERFGGDYRLVFECGDPVLMCSLAARGFGIAIMPRMLAELGGANVALRSLEPPARLPAALVWRRARRPSPAAQTFIDFVREQAER
jgi:DNA-binding transcriptional LysR family regulator